MRFSISRDRSTDSKVYYCCKPEDAEAIGFDNAEIDRQLAKPMGERSLEVKQLLEQYSEALAVYQGWATNRQRVRY